MGRFAAVLLDMDGTLVDSDAAVERAWERWAAEAGVPIADLRPRMHGNPAPTTIRAVRPGYDEAAVHAAAARQLQLQYTDLDDVVPTPGTARLLVALKELELPWAVVTSADRPLAQARLGAAGITPPLLVTVEETERGKPHPEPYLTAAARLGVDPARCLVVEDSQPGIDAGRAAGCTVAALRGLAADIRLTDLGDLADLLLSPGP
ncbi:HAD family hydrolase [Dactylosporangium matsuzakiense]|uniref:Phosphatase n=1 Tax=Dactylosporangium matsuzakiense TaxID=53360 RepID=A0A9W6NML7_9ACTN|nr:HAD-IA family hydrolase [Dactylosporangium matsuzakiense]UWZ41618.1 HAD-IA family hydrolase [Dactylosporangium matsuzakiense]GLL02308.1 phosphatase [Dactylosporangium matsuzakiense]